MKQIQNQKKGFTLLEVLLVIALIGILVGIIIVVLNPKARFASARNDVRQSDIRKIEGALIQYRLQEGSYPDGLTSTLKEICDPDIANPSTNCGSNINLSVLIPTYLQSIPQDPNDKDTTGGNGYQVAVDITRNVVAVKAIQAESSATISINDPLLSGLPSPLINTPLADSKPGGLPNLALLDGNGNPVYSYVRWVGEQYQRSGYAGNGGGGPPATFNVTSGWMSLRTSDGKAITYGLGGIQLAGAPHYRFNAEYYLGPWYSNIDVYVETYFQNVGVGGSADVFYMYSQIEGQSPTSNNTNYGMGISFSTPDSFDLARSRGRWEFGNSAQEVIETWDGYSRVRYPVLSGTNYNPIIKNSDTLTVTLTGTGFQAGVTTVRIDGNAVAATVISDTSLTVNVNTNAFGAATTTVFQVSNGVGLSSNTLTIDLSSTPPASPSNTNISLLMNCNVSPFVDSSIYARTITIQAGTPSLSSVQSKFGSKSCLLNSGSRLGFNDTTELDLTGDFTIESWIYPLSTGDRIVAGHSSQNVQIFRLNEGGTGTLSFYLNGVQVFSPVAAGITPNNWYHVAISRSGTVTKMFVNGVQVGSNNTAWSGSFKINMIGINWFGSYFDGYIDDFRVTKGVSWYNSNFTPPTAQLTP
jgi:prepilin-type N-terminal cleavage/methylation domain-containing protein